MSIATEIQRLKTAKANLKSAIISKGVAVGDEKLEQYAALVLLITGGGDDTPPDYSGIMYYGYLESTSTLQKVSDITYDMLSAPTIASVNTAAVGGVELSNVPSGTFTIIAVPSEAGLHVTKDNGFGAKVPFDEDNGLTGTGANGIDVTLNGVAYKVYGEFNIVTGYTKIYINA